MWHSVQGQTRIGASEINTSQRNSFRCEPLPDNKNNPERLLDHPMLEIKNPQPSENSEAQKREQLIAPFHQRDVAAHQFYCQSRNRGKLLVRLHNRRQSARIWPAR